MRGIRALLGVVPLLAAAMVILALPAQASTSVVPAIAVPAIHPESPVAGKTFEITFPVIDAMTGARLTSITSLSFMPTIAGKAVRLEQESYVAGVRAVAGVAWMTMKVPAATEGRLLKVKLTIRAGGLNATRAESYRIGTAAGLT